MTVSRVNPKCRKIEIGVRTIKEITIWPLSLADEIKFTETILNIVGGYELVLHPPLPDIPEDSSDEEIDSLLQTVESTEQEVATYIIKAIKDNLIELLSYVADTNDEVTLSDMDNEQFMDVCDVIYEMNFAGAVGKGMRLLNKVKSLFTQKTQSENLSSPPATDTNTSTDSATEKAE